MYAPVSLEAASTKQSESMKLFKQPISIKNGQPIPIPAPANQNHEVHSMLLEKAENNPKSIELIIDTPDFYDYADVQ